MSYNLQVVGMFEGYQRGDTITDPATIARILASEASTHVRRVPADDPHLAAVTAKALAAPANQGA